VHVANMGEIRGWQNNIEVYLKGWGEKMLTGFS
jgi:hypothetical protein